MVPSCSPAATGDVLDQWAVERRVVAALVAADHGALSELVDVVHPGPDLVGGDGPQGHALAGGGRLDVELAEASDREATQGVHDRSEVPGLGDGVRVRPDPEVGTRVAGALGLDGRDGLGHHGVRVACALACLVADELQVRDQ
jgi:hypothetical protein